MSIVTWWLFLDILFILLSSAILIERLSQEKGIGMLSSSSSLPFHLHLLSITSTIFIVASKSLSSQFTIIEGEEVIGDSDGMKVRSTKSAPKIILLLHFWHCIFS